MIPPRGHIPPLPGGLSAYDVGTFGPLGRSAADLALGLDLLAGEDRTAVAVACHLERLLGGFTPPPAFA